MVEATPAEKPDHTALWTKVVTGAVGALLLGLQGVNLSELGNVSAQGQQRAEALKVIEQEGAQRAKALEGIAESLANQQQILQNGSKMLEHDRQLFENQERILDLIEQRLNKPDVDSWAPRSQEGTGP